MGRFVSRWTLAVVALAAVVAVVAGVAITRGSDSEDAPVTYTGQPEQRLEQRNEGGGVVVKATLVSSAHAGNIKLPEANALDLGQQAAVHIAIDTHSGDLRNYDFIAGAKLSNGGPAVAPSRWIVTANDAHHLEGVLVFDRPAGGGEVRLVLRDLGGVPERAFRWERLPE